MIVSSPTSTCVKNVVHLSGRIQHMGGTILNVVSRGESGPCSLMLQPGHSRSSYAWLSVSNNLSCLSAISSHTLQRTCFGSVLSKQGSNLQTLTVKGLASSRCPWRRCFNISLPCRNMNVGFSLSKGGMLSKVKGDFGNISWSHGCASTGITFGLLLCYASSEPVFAEASVYKKPSEGDCNSSDANISYGKKVYTDYSIIGIPGDGRCLFRSVVHGACLRAGKPAPVGSLQRDLADDLRDQVADEFIKRREETEWFVEGDFDTYVAQMRKPHVWGGEPELLMASHVLRMPITVYMHDKNAGGLISIAEYGQEYSKENPIRVIYHGSGHYDALEILANKGGKSRL